MNTVLLSGIIKIAVVTKISAKTLNVVSGKKDMGSLISGIGWLSVGIGILQLITQSYSVVLDSGIVKVISFIWHFIDKAPF